MSKGDKLWFWSLLLFICFIFGWSIKVEHKRKVGWDTAVELAKKSQSCQNGTVKIQKVFPPKDWLYNENQVVAPRKVLFGREIDQVDLLEIRAIKDGFVVFYKNEKIGSCLVSK